MARLCPLFSGSSGNSTLIGGAGGYILVDAGKSAKKITDALREHTISPDSIAAIFITHEHIDHVQGVRVFASRHKIPVFATAGTLEQMDASGHLNGVSANELPSGGVDAADMHIDFFRTMHDAVESCGYVVHTADERRIAVATDMGCITEQVHNALAGCDAVVLESNHDVGILENGPYPYPLKRRILSDMGHLSNDCCAQEIVRLARTGTTRFILGHLSRENNIPILARQTSLSALCCAGLREDIDFRLTVAMPDGIEMMKF